MKALFIRFLLTSDPFLGKVDKESLSQHTLMELLIEGLVNKEQICGSQENPKDLKDWKDVTLDQNLEVVEIEWYYLVLEGSIDLQWLPATVQVLRIFETSVNGTVDFTSLPREMRQIDLSFNKLTGEVDLRSLPDALEEIDVSYNKFSGTLNLTSLPIKIKVLLLNNNDFFGETDFSFLPKSLCGLKVSTTNLSGEIRHENRKTFDVNNSGVKIIQ